MIPSELSDSPPLCAPSPAPTIRPKVPGVQCRPCVRRSPLEMEFPVGGCGWVKPVIQCLIECLFLCQSSPSFRQTLRPSGESTVKGNEEMGIRKNRPKKFSSPVRRMWASDTIGSMHDTDTFTNLTDIEGQVGWSSYLGNVPRRVPMCGWPIRLVRFP